MKFYMSALFMTIYLICASCAARQVQNNASEMQECRLTILLKESVNPNVLIKEFPKMTVIAQTSRSQNQWLFIHRDNTIDKDALLSRVKKSKYVRDVIIHEMNN